MLRHAVPIVLLLLVARSTFADVCDPHNEHDVDHTSCYPQCSFIRSRALECELCKCKACSVCKAETAPPSPPPPRPYWWADDHGLGGLQNAVQEGDAVLDDEVADVIDPEDEVEDEPESAADAAEKALMGIFAKHPPPSPPPPSPPPSAPAPPPKTPPPSPPSPPSPPPHPSHPPNQPRAKPGEPGTCSTNEIDLTSTATGIVASASTVEKAGFDASNAGALESIAT